MKALFIFTSCFWVAAQAQAWVAIDTYVDYTGSWTGNSSKTLQSSSKPAEGGFSVPGRDDDDAFPPYPVSNRWRTALNHAGRAMERKCDLLCELPPILLNIASFHLQRPPWYSWWLMPSSMQGLDHLDWLLQDFLASLRFFPAMADYGLGWWDASWGRAEDVPQVTCAVGVELVTLALLHLQLIHSSPCRML